MFNIARVIGNRLPIVRDSKLLKSIFYTLHPPVNVAISRAKATFVIKSRADLSNVNSNKEKARIRETLEYIDDDDVFFDIGAYRGLWTCLISSVIPDSQVIAFEPNPENYEKLKTNIKYNNQNVKTYNIALSSSNGNVKFDLDKAMSSVSLGTNNSESVQEIHTQRCDELIENENIAIPSIVKIDVEGFEMDVLKGMSDVLSDIEFIIIELHSKSMKKYDSTPESLVRLLEKKGFQVELRASDDTEVRRPNVEYENIPYLIAKNE